MDEFLNPITNENSQGMLKEYGITKPQQKREYKLTVYSMQNALYELQQKFIKEVPNDGLWRFEGYKNYQFAELLQRVTKEYEITTKKEMDNLYDGVMRSVHKMKRVMNNR
ncbi:MAG: hypothetical protein ACOC1K_07695 [Nanoarchaeota archaeon]